MAKGKKSGGAFGTKKYWAPSMVGLQKGVTPINPPWWGEWGGNRANVPVPDVQPNYGLFDLPNVQRPVWMEPDYGSIAFPNWQPSAATQSTPATSATVPGTVANPEMRYFNPYLQTAPTGVRPPGGNQVPNDYVPLWNPWQDPVFQWENDMSGLSGEFREGINPTDFDYYDQNFVWDEEKYGPKEEWSSSYHPLYYQGQKPDSLNWLAGSSNGGNMGSRGWRRPGRYYIPDQQVTRAGPNGPITAERPKPPPRRGETPNPEGNNKNLTIPAWVGSLVSWRT
jgi:hypothetical protein